jgi:hypothetical protein
MADVAEWSTYLDGVDDDGEFVGRLRVWLVDDFGDVLGHGGDTR